MTFALGTLLFLLTLWMLAVVGAAVLEQSKGKILAALKGQVSEPALQVAPVRMRHAPRGNRALRATPRLRAAA